MSNFQRLLNMASKALDKNGSSSTGSGKTDWREMVRTAADKVTGDDRSAASPTTDRSTNATVQGAQPALSNEDRAAIARYDYLLKTAQPDQLETVHRDAFARLTPEQRNAVEAQLQSELPANERPASASPADLARSATRGEAHNPGFLRKIFAKPTGRGVAGAGLGAAAGAGIGAAGIGAAGGLLAAVAGGAILSSVATPLLEQAAGMGVDFDSLAGGLDGITEGAAEYTSGLGEQVSDLGSNFEIPGLSGLSGLFGRDN